MNGLKVLIIEHPCYWLCQYLQHLPSVVHEPTASFLQIYIFHLWFYFLVIFLQQLMDSCWGCHHNCLSLKNVSIFFWGGFPRGSDTFTLEVWICWKTSRNMTNKIFAWRVYFLQLIVFCWVALISSLQQPVQVIIIQKNYIYVCVCIWVVMGGSLKLNFQSIYIIILLHVGL